MYINKKRIIGFVVVLAFCAGIWLIMQMIKDMRKNEMYREFSAYLLREAGRVKVDVSEAILLDPENIKLSEKIQTLFPKLGKAIDLENIAGRSVNLELFTVTDEGKIVILTSGVFMYFELTPIISPSPTGIDIFWHCYGQPGYWVPPDCRREKLITSQSSSPASQVGTH